MSRHAYYLLIIWPTVQVVDKTFQLHRRLRVLACVCFISVNLQYNVRECSLFRDGRGFAHSDVLASCGQRSYICYCYKTPNW